MQAYLNGKRAEDARVYLDGAGNSTQQSHSLVRNNLLFRLAISNASRTGCLTNMTLLEFNIGCTDIQGGDHVVRVADHKTRFCILQYLSIHNKTCTCICRSTYGPAEVFLIPELYADIEKYVSCYREETECPSVFVSWGGNQMCAGGVASALTTELGHAGVDKR